MKYILLLSAIIGLGACGGDGCATVFVPTHEVTVYDEISGEQLCWIQRGAHSSGACKIVFEQIDSKMDISVELDGYESKFVKGAEDFSVVYSCFDQYEYTTKIDVFLTRN